MSPRTARVIAGAIVLLSLTAAVTSIPIGLAARQRIEPGQIVVVGDLSTPRMQETLRELERERTRGDALEASTGDYNPGFAVLVVLLLMWLAVGFLIVWRQPRNWAGWIFLITGAPFPLLTLGQALVIFGLKAEPGSVPLVGLWATLGEYAFYPIALLPLLFLLYPDGHAPSRRWRRAVTGLVGGTAVAILGFLFRPGPYNNWIEDGILYENPFGIDALADIAPRIITFGTVIALVSGLSTVVAVRQRFKRATGEERQQMRWLMYVASLAGFFFVTQWVVSLGAVLFVRDADAPVFEALFALTAFTIVLGIPAAYLVAIFRHGLWDLDVVVKKTVQYGVLVAGSTAVVGLVFVAIPTAVFGVGGDVLDPVPIAIGAILTAGLMLIRIRARRWANRVVYGKRATPYEVLSEFGERVGETYSTEDVLPRMVQLLGEASGARTARVWLRIGDEMRVEASWPPGVAIPPGMAVRADELPTFGDEEAFEVKHQGELLGALTVSPAADDPMNPTKEKLIRDMAAQAGLVLRNVRLIEDLRESRRRIVSAQDERARALERNIHDGAQQQLVALSVQLRLAEGMVDRDPAKARGLLVDLQARTVETLEDLRDLARGIYPPLLADKGLPAALEAQARKSPVPVSVQPDGVGRYVPDVESAVYFCCLEALNNVAKYAEASTVEIRLRQDEGELRFEIVDDGRGFDAAAKGGGTGLQGMADRLDAIGGTLEVRSAPEAGTTISGVVPTEMGSEG
ncbi:MAG TPA: histidine kinase [Actinomycetota bacterium]|nr:histidine kinase [Actinomycetota bacterium]